METDPAVTLEKLTAEYRHKLNLPTAELEVIVPLWWVQRWGHEALAAASARMNVKIQAVNTWQEAQDQLSALVFQAGTWHVESASPLDLSGAQQHGI